MVDILERLQSPRTSLGTLWPQPNLHEEAAEKIIQLRKELDETKRAADTFVENEHLREENARLIRENKVAFEAVGGVVKANDKLKEENARLAALSAKASLEASQLREVLKPFVKTLELNCTEADPDDFCIDQKGALSVGDLRAARAAIREGGNYEN